jgi:predicted membrane chloride channel (bestrophin family)
MPTPHQYEQLARRMRQRATRVRQCWHAMDRLGLPVDAVVMARLSEANDALVRVAEECERLARGPVPYRPLIKASYTKAGLGTRGRADFVARGIERG